MTRYQLGGSSQMTSTLETKLLKSSNMVGAKQNFTPRLKHTFHDVDCAFVVSAGMVSNISSDETGGEEEPMRRGKPPASNSSAGWGSGQEEQVVPLSGNGAARSADSPSKSASKSAVPGRARRRVPLATASTPSKQKKQASFWTRFHARWIEGYSPLLLAVLAWYLLGVVSIGTSKLLLMAPTNHVGNVPPMFLTLQQLFLGSTLLRYLLRIRAFGSAGMQPFPSEQPVKASHRSRKAQRRSFWKSPRTDLTLAGLYFTIGFLATNFSFHRASAAFVETIKAAEPLTSASVAVCWGIESLGLPEVSSLLAVVAGVLLSTWGNATNGDASSSGSVSESGSLSESIQSCIVVMTANLCFSFRGLHQKLFRASSTGSTSEIDDLNLQFRMQQLGVLILLGPVLMFDAPEMIANVWELSRTVGLIQSGILSTYVGLAVVNGLAFTSYNLASTFVLTRISVVHHAALNCIRRIFAIIVTSFMFGIPITLVGSIGIMVSFTGFLCFTHYKARRLRQPKPLSSLLPMSSHERLNEPAN